MIIEDATRYLNTTERNDYDFIIRNFPTTIMREFFQTLSGNRDCVIQISVQNDCLFSPTYAGISVSFVLKMLQYMYLVQLTV